MKRTTLIYTLFLATLASSALVARAQYAAYDLGTLGGTSAFPYGINIAGTVVGWSYASGGDQHAFSYSGGHMTDLGTPGGSSSLALGLNNAGTIVGQAFTSDNSVQHAFSRSGGVWRDLGTLGGSPSVAYSINSGGTIAGWSYKSGGAEHAFSYSGGVMRDLGTLGGSASDGYAINDSGQIVGVSTTAAGNLHAFSWTTGGGMIDLGTLGGLYSWADAINSAGTIVGDSIASGGLHAYVDSGGVMTDLAPYLASIGLTGDSGARSINDNGDIVGFAMTPDGYYHSFLLTMIPEPSTVALLALGGAAWLLRRRGAF